MTRLVLLPGMDGTGELFAPFIKALGDIPAQVIHYPTDRELDYRSLENLVRTQLPIAHDYVLLAESFSGPIGIAIAASHPAGLRGLILCATFASNPLPFLGPLRRLLAVIPVSRISPSLAAPWLYAGRGTPELRRAHAHAMARVSPRVIRTRAAAVLAVDRRDDLMQVAVPMLYLRANRDRMVPAAAGNAILALRPDVELLEFDAPHFLLQTEAAACAAAARDFLRRSAS